RLKLKLTDESKLEQVDLRLEDGKLRQSVKAIQLKDLYPGQPVSVVLVSDGRELTLLRGVASGAGLHNKDLTDLVRKLGGTLKRVNWTLEAVLYWVNLNGTQADDDDVRQFSQFTGLYELDLSFTRVTDKGVAHLAGAPHLRNVDLAGTKVTDAVVPHLRTI